MSDRSIDVLDSHIRFTDPDRAADVLGTLRGPDLPLAVVARGRRHVRAAGRSERLR